MVIKDILDKKEAALIGSDIKGFLYDIETMESSYRYEYLKHEEKVKYRADRIEQLFQWRDGALLKPLEEEWKKEKVPVSPQSKYIPVKDRSDCLKGKEKEITAGLIELLEANNYKLSLNAGQVSNVVMPLLRKAILRPDWEERVEKMDKLTNSIMERLHKIHDAVDKLHIRAMSGTLEDPIGSYNELKKEVW